MALCQGYSCLARSLEQQDEREAQEAQVERAAAQRHAGGGQPIVAPVLSMVAAPGAGVFAGTPLDIIRAALDPLPRRSVT